MIWFVISFFAGLAMFGGGMWHLLDRSPDRIFFDEPIERPEKLALYAVSWGVAVMVISVLLPYLL